MLKHHTYEVKAWVKVDAISEHDALEKAAALLDLLPDDVLGSTSLEGLDAVYDITAEQGLDEDD